MVYVYYNLPLWVRQIHKAPDVDVILLDRIDTTVAWRVETERPIMESIPYWLHEEAKQAVVGEREVEEEDVLEQTPLQEVAIDMGCAPPPSRTHT